MKVILLHEVPGLGKPGDVKDVAKGYARNYLLPRQLVQPALPSALRTLQDNVAAARRRTEKQQAENQSLSARIGAVALTFAVRVGRGDRLYGSVTSQNIADALLEQEGLRIDRRAIALAEPLRQLGTVEVPVRVAAGVETHVKVSLVSSESLATGAAADASAVSIVSPTSDASASETPESGAEAPKAAEDHA